MKHTAAFVLLLTIAGTPATTLACVGRCVPDATPVTASCHFHESGAGARVTDTDDSCARLLVTSLIAGSATAQTSSGRLNSFEVQRLVTENTPEANATLAKHFAALADKYAAEAAVHTAMATAYTGNPNHSLGGNMGVHCRKLAEIATTSAHTAREMVAYHNDLAAGATPEVPKGAVRFDAGEGAPAPTAPEIKGLAAAARTPADHHALQEYFLTIAKEHTADAKEHAVMANMFRVGGQRRGSEFAAMHCDRLARDARGAAKEATAAAELHRQLANVS